MNRSDFRSSHEALSFKSELHGLGSKSSINDDDSFNTSLIKEDME